MYIYIYIYVYYKCVLYVAKINYALNEEIAVNKGSKPALISKSEDSV